MTTLFSGSESVGRTRFDCIKKFCFLKFPSTNKLILNQNKWLILLIISPRLPYLFSYPSPTLSYLISFVRSGCFYLSQIFLITGIFLSTCSGMMSVIFSLGIPCDPIQSRVTWEFCLRRKSIFIGNDTKMHNIEKN